jgi:aspartate dehydrogenase
MSKLLKIGIAGCGAIGSSLAKAIVENFSHKAELVSVFDTDRTKAYSLASSIGKKKIAVLTFENLLSNVDFVIESTSVNSAFSIVKEALSAGKDIMVMSSGGIFGHFEQLCNLATEKGVRLFTAAGL